MIYFDVTEIVHYAARSSRLTGIQRVQFNVIVRLAARHGHDLIRCLYYDQRIGALTEFDSRYLAAHGEFDATALLAKLGLTEPATFLPSGAALKTYLRNHARSKPHRVWLKTKLYLRALVDRQGLLNDKLLSRPTLEQPSAAYQPKPVAELPASAHLVHMGSSWNFPSTWRFAEQHKARGGDVVQYIHDLIPITHPQFMTRKEPPAFVHWLQQTFQYATRFPCNSQWVANDLCRFMDTHRYPGNVGVVPLAHEFLGFAPRTEVPRPAEFSDWRSRGFVVCVGTIEARKNGLSLLKVWERLIDKLGTDLPTLVFAGRLGRIGGDEFRDYLDARPSLQRVVKVIHSPSDQMMAWLYRNSLFTIYPSHVEGWGLPVGESAWFGRLCLASSSSSIPEVLGSYADYVDPTDLQDIERAVIKLVSDRAYLELREAALNQQPLRTWQDVADDFYDYVMTAR